MNILYYSAHSVLEHDEIAIFKALGHNVCSLGTVRNKMQQTMYRHARDLNSVEESFYTKYEEAGGEYDAPADSDRFIPESFASQFDVVIVMHQFHIIQQNWRKFSGCRVVWRTIGQDIDNHERYLGYYRQRGMLIVRYSEAELEAPG